MGETGSRPAMASLETICTQIFAEAGAWRKVLIGGLLCLSIIGLPWAFGYIWRYLIQIRQSGDFTLPAWDDFLKLCIPGLFALGVFLLWFVLPLLIMLLFEAILGSIFAPLGFLAMTLAGAVLWMVCGLYVSALLVFQRDPGWAALVEVDAIWPPFANNWYQLLVPGLAFLGLMALFLPILPFAFFGGILPLIGYISQLYIVSNNDS